MTAPIEARTVAEREARWITRARTGDPGWLPALLATPWPARWTDAWRRIEHLIGWPERDERILEALARMVVEAPYHTYRTDAEFYGPILEHLVARRAIEVVELLEPPMDRRAYDDHQGHIPVFDARWDAVEALRALPAEPDDLDAVLARVYADPTDLGARLVYADRLSEAGDPRGAFILASVTGADHADRLLPADPLAYVDPAVAIAIEPRSVRYRNGFVADAVLRRQLHAVRFDAPAWATLERLDIPNRVAPPSLTTTSWFPRLHTVFGLKPSALDAVIQSGVSWRATSVLFDPRAIPILRGVDLDEIWLDLVRSDAARPGGLFEEIVGTLAPERLGLRAPWGLQASCDDLLLTMPDPVQQVTVQLGYGALLEHRGLELDYRREGTGWRCRFQRSRLPRKLELPETLPLRGVETLEVGFDVRKPASRDAIRRLVARVPHVEGPKWVRGG